MTPDKLSVIVEMLSVIGCKFVSAGIRVEIMLFPNLLRFNLKLERRREVESELMELLQEGELVPKLKKLADPTLLRTTSISWVSRSVSIS